MRPLALLLALSAPLSAQTFLSAHGGAVDFDLSGTGQTGVFEIRVGTFVRDFLAVEGGLGISDVPEQFGGTYYALPSVELQLGVPVLDRVRPYLGAGVGLMVPLSRPAPFRRQRGDLIEGLDYDPPVRSSVNLGLGVDVGLTPDVAGRVAGRARLTSDIEDVTAFSGSFSEVTVGLSFRL